MKIGLALAALASTTLLITGCGKSSGGSSSTTTTGADSDAVSCNMPDMGVCIEDAKSEELGASIGCGMFKGTFAKTACAADKRIGVCTDKGENGKPGSKKVYYLGNMNAPLVDDAKKDCTENPLKPGGTFVAVAGVDDAAKAAAMPQAAQITGSCASQSGEKCDDYVGKGVLDDDHATSCKELSGTFSPQPCASAKLVGTCRGSGVASRYYAGGPSKWKVADAQKDCEMMSGNHFFPAANQPAAPAAPAAPKKKTASR